MKFGILTSFLLILFIGVPEDCSGVERKPVRLLRRTRNQLERRGEFRPRPRIRVPDSATSAQNQQPQVVSAPGQGQVLPTPQDGSSFIAFTLNPGNPETGEAPTFQIYPPLDEFDDYSDLDEDDLDDIDDNEVDDLLAQEFARALGLFPSLRNAATSPRSFPGSQQRPSPQVYTPTIGRNEQGQLGYHVFIPIQGQGSTQRPQPQPQPQYQILPFNSMNRRFLPDYLYNRTPNQVLIQPQGGAPLSQGPLPGQVIPSRGRPYTLYRPSLPSTLDLAPPTSLYYTQIAQPQTRQSVRVLPPGFQGPLRSFPQQFQQFQGPQPFVQQQQPNGRVYNPRAGNNQLKFLPIAEVFPIARVLPGGLGAEKPADNTVRGIVSDLMEEIRQKITEKLGTSTTTPPSGGGGHGQESGFEVISYRTQVVVGTNYFIRIKLGDKTIWDLRIYKDLDGNKSVTNVNGPRMANDTLDYFE